MVNTHKPVMLPEDFRLLREFIAEKFGLVMDETKENYLGREISHRLKVLRLNSFFEYYALLKYAPDHQGEIDHFIPLITNNETTFFREESQLTVFADRILPELKEKRTIAGMKRLTIMSAGCSTGEEVYTLAILLLESGLFLWDWDVRVVGVDIDPDVLVRAERGVYSGRAFQSTPPHIIERYFRKCGDGFAVRDVIRRMTSFVRCNLLELNTALPAIKADVVFCRNVLIYFGDETIKKVVASFSNLLSDDGFLFLGHSESLVRITDHYIPLRFPGTIIYRNRERKHGKGQ